MVILDNLFDRLKEKGITASKLSAETGISTGNISDWKSGRSLPTAVKLDIIADYLDCSIDYLLGRTDIPEVNRGKSKIVPIQLHNDDDTLSFVAEQPLSAHPYLDNPDDDDDDKLHHT